MGGKVSAVIFVLTSLLVTAPAVFAFATEETEYRQTVLKLENLSHRDLTAAIGKEVKRNDHTARVLLDSKQKSLLIIHHKSINKSEDISDRGAGIPADILENIFKPFVTGKKKGTDLGLPISLKIVGAHGGKLVYRNNTDAGTTFRVSIPKSH